MNRCILMMAFVCLRLSLLAQTVDVTTFEKGMKGEEVQLLDVRTAKEFNTGHLQGALQADFNKKPEFQDRVQYLDKSRPVYVYCLAGIRSAGAATWLRENGFKQVIEMDGGINAWKQAGKPLDGANPAPQMTTAEFIRATANGTVLVDVGASWCPPCRKMEPIIAELQASNSVNFSLVKVDGGNDTDVMKSITATTLPTFIIYKNGRETWRKAGPVMLGELKAALAQ
ncbi:rhodanese-like domain-containing protein [Chitinophaga horti]|uniref:Rhodanese-like domain-containing protein n=1 Tax=Chitinophaga horti TaxID=2920382 RepID=A0ABY6J5K3_9BACT|nr:rhodanese-like domain-containing protein [Chitinophaga horti]UYQ93581.1 rhodanese-like domain-containing protein [Chitinophaga horti]